MNADCELNLAGERLWLLGEKAIWWPAQAALLIADAHFGKAAAYRRLGQPVPHGTTSANLQVLQQLLDRHPARQLIFLGDFLHGPGSHAPGTLNQLRAWRLLHPELRITLIRGNHDHRAGDPPADLGIEVVAEPLLLGPYALQHEPHPHPERHVLAGHVHPVFFLTGRGRQRLRLPCFHVGQQVTLLPAFGAFTGGFAVERKPGVRLFVVGDSQVWPVG
ncbi:ligase-associated DNA damage response endonuclease PdeM [Pseudomonas sp. RIT-PI-S]|uniref:ligase-associated DNA damage response endonuclease PdeM n=1 Tax=Pseudomonas sp. RIT-PI-S TaxID=3035295 RepID=UPI0021DB3599|nr:ligase-associated DNA damage response endonuclease PdeM [Pseudomonas sp. RIT-PI-S]